MDLRIEVFGRVQGVRFRQFVKDVADKFCLKGHVLNKKSGSVLIVAQGDKKKLEEFLSVVQKGSVLSKVEGVYYHWESESEKYRDFRIKIDQGFIKDQKLSFINLGKRVLGIGNGPRHVVIIPDGNRRWAKKKGFDEIEGHKKSGAYDNLKMLLNKAKDLKIKYLTLWGFSTENWKRSKREVNALFKLMNGLLARIEEDVVKEKIRFRHLGRKDRLPSEMIEIIKRLEEKTKNFKEFNLQICLDYGGRDELVRAVNKAVKSGVDINEKNLGGCMDSAGIPDPDLIIRTSGEKRLSGFMPFQSVYSEFYFTDVHFPDFKPEHLREAVDEFKNRRRRIGGN
jgi:undecaprenyl diphosphate synthase